MDNASPDSSTQPQDPIASVGKSYLGFLKTRLGRLNYFLGGLLVGALFYCFSTGLFVFVATYRGAAPSDATSIITSISNNPMVIGIYLLLTLPLAIRRLHDMNRSGWWLVLVYALSFIPIINLIPSLLLLFKKGTPTPNKYGSPNRNVSIKEIFGLGN